MKSRPPVWVWVPLFVEKHGPDFKALSAKIELTPAFLTKLQPQLHQMVLNGVQSVNGKGLTMQFFLGRMDSPDINAESETQFIGFLVNGVMNDIVAIVVDKETNRAVDFVVLDRARVEDLDSQYLAKAMTKEGWSK